MAILRFVSVVFWFYDRFAWGVFVSLCGFRWFDYCLLMSFVGVLVGDCLGYCLFC